MIDHNLDLRKLGAGSQAKALVGVSLSFLLLLGLGCSSGFLKSDKAAEINKLDDYDKVMKVQTIAPPPSKEKKVESPKVAVKKAAVKKAVSPKKKTAVKKKKRKIKKARKPRKHYPALEGLEGFDGRRPLVDPFRPGEKVELRLTYFGISAGTMTIEVAPFVKVNGKKSYHFIVRAKSNSFFSNIYKVDDWAETFLDYKTMLPYNYAVHVKESKQLKEIRSYFDWKRMKSKYWEKRITKDKGLQEKNREWDVLPYSQNVFTAAFYLRCFELSPGKVIKFRLADDKKNMVVSAEVLRKEKLETDVGDLATLVIRPKVAIEGMFKPMGEVLFWVTDDDRKMVVKISSKIKIGKIVGYLNSIEKGE